MKASENAYALIKKYEGLRLKSYQDTGGKWTVGWGHTHNACPGKTITLREAEMFFKWDIDDTKTHLDDVIKKYNLSFNQNQYDALISFIFNIGIGQFKRSTLLKLIREDVNHPDIIRQFKRWKYDAGVVQPGLVKRRAIESALYVS